MRAELEGGELNDDDVDDKGQTVGGRPTIQHKEKSMVFEHAVILALAIMLGLAFFTFLLRLPHSGFLY